MGWARFRNSRPVEGSVKQITIAQDGGRWLVSLTTELEKALPAGDEIVAADRGVRDTLALSNEQRIAPLDAHKSALHRLCRYGAVRPACETRTSHRRRRRLVRRLNFCSWNPRSSSRGGCQRTVKSLHA